MKDCLLKDMSALDLVVDPSNKKMYMYVETDPVKRFFSKDRMKLLKEV